MPISRATERELATRPRLTAENIALGMEVHVVDDDNENGGNAYRYSAGQRDDVWSVSRLDGRDVAVLRNTRTRWTSNWISADTLVEAKKLTRQELAASYLEDGTSMIADGKKLLERAAILRKYKTDKLALSGVLKEMAAAKGNITKIKAAMKGYELVPEDVD